MTEATVKSRIPPEFASKEHIWESTSHSRELSAKDTCREDQSQRAGAAGGGGSNSPQASGSSGGTVGRSSSSASFSSAPSDSGGLSVGVSASDDRQKSQIAESHFDARGHFSSRDILPLLFFLEPVKCVYEVIRRGRPLAPGDPTPVFACAADRGQSFLVNYYFRIIHCKIRV